MDTLSKERFKKVFLEKLHTIQGEDIERASIADKYMALANTIREILLKKWVQTNSRYRQEKKKQVYYFSMEYLLGRLIESNLINLGIRDLAYEALDELGIQLKTLEEYEHDAGLGNGGLGRLAACFLDSLASLGLPGHGCGIRYKYGHFEQKIIDGHQVELPESWLKDDYIWEMRRRNKAVVVKFGGNVTVDEVDGELAFHHKDYEPVLAVPHDIPVVGYKKSTVNTLRLFSAESEKEFDFPSFSRGHYLKAVEYKYETESISQILYPDDTHIEGRVLRLKQEYFMVSAGIQSILRTFKRGGNHVKDLPELVGIHINDTHPALAVPELMRILMDEERMKWDEAWEITTKTISFTNHTIMAEAMEVWSEEVVKEILPRIHMIIVEINERFCKEIWDRFMDWDFVSRVAILSHGYVKMAHLAIVGSYSVNGVAALHTEILKKYELHDFYRIYPERFNNKTNGITHRRWLLQSNPLLAELITETIGPDWIKNPKRMIALMERVDDPSFLENLKEIKKKNKKKLAAYIKREYDLSIDPCSIFDVHIKRIHSYKRQLMNALHILHLYNSLREDPDRDIVPRTFLFGGKAAPSFYYAKQIIKFINVLANKINHDPHIQDKLKVLFIENYGVSLAEIIIPAADISEQISTASKEASGTGNMKLMMNGALTIGTLDGANIEIRDAIGDDNIFTFGLTSKEVLDYYHYGGYSSKEIYHENKRIKRLLDQLVNNFLPVPSAEFQGLYRSLIDNNDEYFVLKDFDPYVKTQELIDSCYRNEKKWQKKCAINIAHSGSFSSDRTISQYADEIWKISNNTL